MIKPEIITPEKIINPTNERVAYCQKCIWNGKKEYGEGWDWCELKNPFTGTSFGVRRKTRVNGEGECRDYQQEKVVTKNKPWWKP